jgi:cell surface protein SprA
MQRLYDYIGLGKKNKAKSRSADPNDPDAKVKKTGFTDALKDVLTMVKRINVNYSETNGKVLPGYTQSIGFIGTTKPSLGFVFGSQADVRFEAAKNGWLTEFEDFNEQFIQETRQLLNISAEARPVRDLTINLAADRQYADRYQESYKVVGDSITQSLGNQSGNFSISTIMIGTAFGKSDEITSKNFDEFKANRLAIAQRLAARDGLDPSDVDEEGFPTRYGKTQQDVLLPAFYAAYAGQDAGKVKLGYFRSFPLPNWDLKYTGFMRYKWFKKRFRRFSLAHGYRASYSINSFQTNLERTQLINEGNEPINPENDDYLPQDIISNVVMTDQFNPLMRVDFEMKNSLSVLAEVRRDRSMALSFDNNLLTEINGKEYTLGFGKRFKDVKMVTYIGGQ